MISPPLHHSSRQLFGMQDGSSDGSRINKTVQRGTTVTSGDSIAIFMDGVDKSDTNSIKALKTSACLLGNSASPRFAYLMHRGAGGGRGGGSQEGGSYEGGLDGRKSYIMNNSATHNRNRSRLTLPYLTHCQQTVSLDIPNTNSESPRLMHAASDCIIRTVQQKTRFQNSSLGSPELPVTTEEQDQDARMPPQPISICVRQPSYKPVFLGKSTETLMILLF